jgi:hypothetical protein
MLRIQRLGMFLEAHFGEVEYHMPDEGMETDQEGATPDGEPSFLIQLDDAEARIKLLSMVRPFIPVWSAFPVVDSMHRRLTAIASCYGDVSKLCLTWQ